MKTTLIKVQPQIYMNMANGTINEQIKEGYDKVISSLKEKGYDAIIVPDFQTEIIEKKDNQVLVCYVDVGDHKRTRAQIVLDKFVKFIRENDKNGVLDNAVFIPQTDNTIIEQIITIEEDSILS